jgi:hypothetical protein
VNKLEKSLAGKPLWDLPKSISDEFIDSYNFTSTRWLGNWLYFAILLSGFYCGYKVWNFSEKETARRAQEAAIPIDGFAYDNMMGLGLSVGLFVWLVFAGVVLSLILRLTPMPRKGALFISAHADTGWHSKTSNPFGSPSHMSANSENARDLINQFLDRKIKKTTKFLSPFMFIAITLTILELNWYSITSPTGLHRNNPITNNMSFETWQDAHRVELGCNQIENDSNIIYEVIWADGKKKRLPIDTHFDGQNWLRNMEAIDASIKSGDAEFVRWEWRKRDPLHPQCLRSFYAKQDPDGKARIDRLLRIGQLEN